MVKMMTHTEARIFEISKHKNSWDHRNLWSIKNHKYDAMAVSNLARSWSFSTQVSYSSRKVVNWGTLNLPNLWSLITYWVTALHVRGWHPSVDTGIGDLSKFQARNHRSKKNWIDIFYIFKKASLIAERKAHSTA